MKNLIYILLLTLLIIFPNQSLAQKSTPTASPSENELPETDEEVEQVQKIKDIVAKKVAELNLVEKRGIIASVKDLSNTKIMAEEHDGETIEINVDELTKFEFEDKDFGISDLEVGATYSFVGLFNKDTEKLLARFISEPDSIPVHIEGAIKKINEDDFQIEVVDKDGNLVTIDIEKATNTMVVGKKGELSESGFSSLAANQRIIVIGFFTEDNLFSSSRIIHFEDIPASADILAKIADEVNTATGSGNSLEILEIEEEE